MMFKYPILLAARIMMFKYPNKTGNQPAPVLLSTPATKPRFWQLSKAELMNVVKRGFVLTATKGSLRDITVKDGCSSLIAEDEGDINSILGGFGEGWTNNIARKK